MSTHDPDEDDPPRRRRDEDDDDRPRRRRRVEADDDDRPSRSSRRRFGDERDDFDEAPSRTKSNRGDGLGIAAMIVGILSVLLGLVTPFGACLCPFVLVGAILALIGSIVAIVMGFAARNRTGSGMGTAGIITGFIALLLSMAVIVLMVIGVGFLALNPPGPPPAKQGPAFNQPKRF